MIDEKGYRASVGAIIINDKNRVFLAQRIGQTGWQFPQGGVQGNETAEEAMFRELYEEVGLKPEQVEVVAETADWLYYDLPRKYIRHHSLPLCIGQKQKWYLLKMLASDDKFKLDATAKPEFDEWTWVYYWQPLKKVINFKRDVYRAALRYFEHIVFPKKG